MTYLVHEMGLEYEFKVLSSKSTAEAIALHGAARMALRIGPIGATSPPGTWRCPAWFWERICAIILATSITGTRSSAARLAGLTQPLQILWQTSFGPCHDALTHTMQRFLFWCFNTSENRKILNRWKAEGRLPENYSFPEPACGFVTSAGNWLFDHAKYSARLCKA